MKPFCGSLVALAIGTMVAGGAAAQAPSTGSGQAFPSKPIRIVVPFPPGGTTDVVARLVAQRLTDSMKQTVVVDNRGGAGGALGADIVAKAAPDGYTLLMANITFPLSSVAQTLAKRSPFNAETDFAGVSIAVNKFPGIRAAVCHDCYTAHQAVEHDDMNVLCLGARVIGAAVAAEIVTSFLGAQFTGEERHQRRLNKILAIEGRFLRT